MRHRIWCCAQVQAMDEQLFTSTADNPGMLGFQEQVRDVRTRRTGFFRQCSCDRTTATVWRISFLIALLVAAAPQAWAKNKIDGLERVAKKACAAGDFRKGIDILADLYVRTEDPTFIFDQGRCYEQNHQWKSAIDRFREFQRKTEGKPEEQADAEKHMAECKRYLDEEAASVASSSPPPPPAKEAPPVTAPPVAVAPPPAVAEVRTPAPVESQPGSALRQTGVVLGSVGLATLVGALLLNLKANSLADKANRDPTQLRNPARNRTRPVRSSVTGSAERRC
jgi:hypothetical protein